MPVTEKDVQVAYAGWVEVFAQLQNAERHLVGCRSNFDDSTRTFARVLDEYRAQLHPPKREVKNR